MNFSRKFQNYFFEQFQHMRFSLSYVVRLNEWTLMDNKICLFNDVVSVSYMSVQMNDKVQSVELVIKQVGKCHHVGQWKIWFKPISWKGSNWATDQFSLSSYLSANEQFSGFRFFQSSILFGFCKIFSHLIDFFLHRLSLPGKSWQNIRAGVKKSD